MIFFNVTKTPLSSLLLLGFATSISALAEYDPTSDLLNAFGSTCSSSSDLAKRATDQAALLTNIAKSLRDDPTCAGLQSSLENLNTAIREQAKFALSHEADQIKNQQIIQKLEIDLLNENAKPVADRDTDYIAAAKASLAQRKVELAEKSAQMKHDQKMQPLNQVDAIQSASNNVINSLKANEQCVNKPNRQGITGQILGGLMGIASTFFSGILGPALSASATIVDNFFRYAEQKGNNDYIKKFRSASMAQSLGCTMEGLAATYCQARDVRTVIRKTREAEESESCDTAVRGARIAGQEIVTLMNWVQSLSLLENLAKDQLIANSLLNEKRVTLIYMKNYIQNAREAQRKSKDPVITFNTLIEGVSTLLPYPVVSSNGNNGTSGSQEFRDFNAAFFRNPANCGIYKFFYTGGKKGLKNGTVEDTVGEPTTANPTGGTSGRDNCIKAFVEAGYGASTIEDIETAVNIYSEKLSVYVDGLLKSIDAESPNAVLARFEARDQRKQIPSDVLLGLQDYLNSSLADLDLSKRKNINLKNYILEVKDPIDKALSIYADDTETDPRKKTDKIYAAFGKDRYDQFRSNIWNVVSLDIERRKEIDPNLANHMVFELSSLSTAQELLKYLGASEREIAGTNEAQGTSQRNINNFYRFFKGPLVETIQDLKRSKSEYDQQRLGLMCMRMLMADKRNLSPAIVEACKGSKYRGEYLAPLSFNEFYNKKDEDRICSVYDYFRKSEIAQRINYKGLKIKESGAIGANTIAPVHAEEKKTDPTTSETGNSAEPPSESSNRKLTCSPEQISSGCSARNVAGSSICKCPTKKDSAPDWRKSVFSESKN